MLRNVSLKDFRAETLLLPENGSLTQRVVYEALKTHRLSSRRTIKTIAHPVMTEAILQGGDILLEGRIPHQERADKRANSRTANFKSCLVVPRDWLNLRLVQGILSSVDDKIVLGPAH